MRRILGNSQSKYSMSGRLRQSTVLPERRTPESHTTERERHAAWIFSSQYERVLTAGIMAYSATRRHYNGVW